MKLTVDANIFFAALIRDGTTRQLWFQPQVRLVAPVFLLAEFEKYRAAIQKKFRGPAGGLHALAERLTQNVELVPDSELKPYLVPASTLCNDENDWLYLACALKKDTVLWSNDQKLQNQNRVPVITTAGLMQRIGWLENKTKKNKTG